MDADLVLRLARNHPALVTIEEGSIGGFHAQVMQVLAACGILDHGFKIRSMILPDRFIAQDMPIAMYAQAELDSRAITVKIAQLIGIKSATLVSKLAQPMWPSLGVSVPAPLKSSSAPWRSSDHLSACMRSFTISTW
jgi:1-deoxy-D-xylulose-5-phosphate synthase